MSLLYATLTFGFTKIPFVSLSGLSACIRQHSLPSTCFGAKESETPLNFNPLNFLSSFPAFSPLLEEGYQASASKATIPFQQLLTGTASFLFNALKDCEA
ncbi:hypothetical protein EYC80_004820 [Monilinia laxa]|uniref:Uncharacterized protein n=1 Tax=Monilinia laxa TaxID=61186 RepID=A0A5N6KIF8_MONLA|nr:hypothetical protein EYC80_004820 [Monilinia laxa]